MSTIYLIRHGKTEANERRLYCGSTDLPLSEQGVSELRRLKRRYFIDMEDHRVITSGMLRTEQTLVFLFGDIPHEIDPRFREVDFGIFEMHSYEEIKNKPEYIRWITGDNESNVPPKGESGAQMRKRVLAAFRELENGRADAVVVAHGGVIAAIMAYLFPGEGRNRYQWQPKPGEGYEITSEYHCPKYKAIPQQESPG